LADHANIHLALVHFPVYNKAGEIVVSSVTTLDVHDISRICRTYSVGSFYVVTPLKTQQVLVGRIVDHWVKGFGAEYNPTRKESLLRTVVKNSLADVVSDIEARCGEKPLQTVTDARPFPGSVGYGDFSARLGAGQHLLIFGTGWGFGTSSKMRISCSRRSTAPKTTIICPSARRSPSFSIACWAGPRMFKI
jgi:tRNA (guanine37-N1)-methyltransferase